MFFNFRKKTPKTQKAPKTQKDFWDKEAESFDSIYGQDGRLKGFLNRVFRKDMEGRFSFVLDNALEHPSPRVLEIACGSGVYTLAFLKRGATHVTGVDLSPRMLKMAESRLSMFSGQYRLIEADFTKLSFSDPFDVVTAVGVFDYIEDPALFLKKMALCTRRVAIATFPRSGTWRAAVRFRRLQLKGCPVYFYDLETIKNHCSKCGMNIRKHEIIGQLHCLLLEPS